MYCAIGLEKIIYKWILSNFSFDHGSRSVAHVALILKEVLKMNTEFSLIMT